MSGDELHARGASQDVRELGALLGDVIESQSSTAMFETVESIRTDAIDYRSGDRSSREAVVRALADLDAEGRRVVARAFTTYFELINLAEERERIRALRRDRQAGDLTDDVASAVETLSERGADAETVQRVLADVLVEPTFTAHPTEARRKTVKAKLRSIAGSLETLDERRLTDDERSGVNQHLRAEATSLWQTPQVRQRSPEPQDEARNVQWYLENTLFDVAGDVYDGVEDALEETYPEVTVPPLFEFRSWAGSDRDGNPHVTPDVTADTLERQRDVLLERYREQLKQLSGVLSQDDAQIDPGGGIGDALAADRDLLPEVARAAAERYPGEPYRQKLRLMRERLDRTGGVRPGGYDDAAALRADLVVIADSLRASGGDVIAETHVDPLARRVETFGLRLASLDLRDHRENHTTTVAEALAAEGVDYRSRDEDGRVAVLTEAILQDGPVIDLGDPGDLSETALRVCERFSRLADWQREYGPDAVDTYCISMTEEPSHVLEVLFLADQAGVVSLPGHAGLDVVPLLETERALSGARRIVGTLLENEAYAQAVAARGDVQEIMLGYSDSNKENGFLAANWSLYRNQRRLASICEDHDVTIRLFHGRGGSISRGGGPMNEALLALPTESVTGQVKFTEQGEAIAEKYANPRIARRNLDQMLNAQIVARHDALDADGDEVPDAWLEAASTMAEAASREYRDLLESEGFVSYFEQATPITVIEDLNLGSRPASRTGERTVEDLRAIPWVFSWTQARCVLPGWYALGTGIDAYLDDGGDLDTLRDLYDGWPFLRTTLDNAALALARSDMEIAAEYADLADPTLRERFYPRIAAEHERAADLVTSVAGRDRLIDREWLAESLERRNPYVDPLHLLQVQLLGIDDRSEREEQTLRLTVKGIAAGMKNTG